MLIEQQTTPLLSFPHSISLLGSNFSIQRYKIIPNIVGRLHKNQFREMENTSTPAPDGNLLISLVTMKMPFGKYKGVVLAKLPVSYLEWFAKKGFPAGKLGMLLATLYEIKLNGLEYLLEPLKTN